MEFRRTVDEYTFGSDSVDKVISELAQLKPPEGIQYAVITAKHTTDTPDIEVGIRYAMDQPTPIPTLKKLGYTIQDMVNASGKYATMHEAILHDPDGFVKRLLKIKETVDIPNKPNLSLYATGAGVTALGVGREEE